MKTVTNKIETLVVGATGVGLSHCLNNPSSTLLVESSAMVGWEFSETMFPGRNLETNKPETKLGTSLKEELIQRKILSENSIHISAIAPVLYKRLHDSEAKYLFHTVISNVEKTSEGYSITIHNASGQSKIQATRILDTTIYGESFIGTSPTITRSNLYVTLNKNSTDASLEESKNPSKQSFTILPGRFESESFLSLALPPTTNKQRWPQARKALHDLWSNKPKVLNNWDIAAVASRLYEIPIPISAEPDHLHHPAILEDNIISSVDVGAQLFQTMEAIA